MIFRFPLILLLAASLLSGCSKQSDSSTPQLVNLGVVEMAPSTPVRHDLGNGKVCVLRAEPLGAGEIELLVMIEKSGREIASTRAMPIRSDSPLELSFGGYQFTLTPHLK